MNVSPLVGFDDLWIVYLLWKYLHQRNGFSGCFRSVHALASSKSTMVSPFISAIQSHQVFFIILIKFCASDHSQYNEESHQYENEYGQV